jgi:hypothetical protein
MQGINGPQCTKMLIIFSNRVMHVNVVEGWLDIKFGQISSNSSRITIHEIGLGFCGTNQINTYWWPQIMQPNGWRPEH